jgi:hypothetical protein
VWGQVVVVTTQRVSTTQRVLVFTGHHSSRARGKTANTRRGDKTIMCDDAIRNPVPTPSWIALTRAPVTSRSRLFVPQAILFP